MATQTHNAQLNQKRAERQKKDSEDSPAEKREVVMHGAKLKCEYASGLGELKVTSNELQLQDQLWATEGDGNNMVNLQFKGNCGHPKWPAQNMSPPPCMSVIKLSPWEKLGTAIVQEQKVLVKESCITCNPDFNSAVASPIPKAENISREEEAVEILNGYFYTEEGIYLGKHGAGNDVNITDKATFSEIEKNKPVEKSKILFFTEKTKLNNEQFLNRANWVFGEGGGMFAERYAMTIENLRQSGKSGYGTKPFATDEDMYRQTMTHGTPIKLLYPDYFTGAYKGHNANLFAVARKDYVILNKNPKMNLSIKAVIDSLTGKLKNEGYNNWRGSGDTLYTEEEKNAESLKSGKTTTQNLVRKEDGKTYAVVSTKKDHYWEPVGKKYRRHSFIKISYDKN